MKKIFSLILAGALLMIAVIPLNIVAAEINTREFLTCISDMSDVWARFNGKQSWDKVYTVDGKYNGADRYPVDGGLMREYMETVFVPSVAEDMLHRNNSGLFYEDGVLYQKGGWSSQLGDSIRYSNGGGYSFEPSESSIAVKSSDGKTAVVSVTYYLLSDINVESSGLVEYTGDLKFTRTSGGWRISGGEMFEHIFDAFPVQDYEGRSAQTGDLLVIVLTAAVSLLPIIAFIFGKIRRIVFHRPAR